MKPIELRAPYLIFVGDEHRPTYAKTGQGLALGIPTLLLGAVLLKTWKLIQTDGDERG